MLVLDGPPGAGKTIILLSVLLQALANLENRHPPFTRSAMMKPVSLIQALLHASPAQVTMDRIRQLVQLVGPEAPTVEYKADMSQGIAQAVAALANTYDR
ncbi:hypothetical protein ACIBF7_43090 [Nonomuraea sp. NPDC050478]|uniref:hypothetical protein n=1 Tax=Nonomuraea sp. NPDC050478 TaxID=3364365 RepID=UPI003792CCBF